MPFFRCYDSILTLPLCMVCVVKHRFTYVTMATAALCCQVQCNGSCQCIMFSLFRLAGQYLQIYCLALPVSVSIASNIFGNLQLVLQKLKSMVYIIRSIKLTSQLEFCKSHIDFKIFSQNECSIEIFSYNYCFLLQPMFVYWILQKYLQAQVHLYQNGGNILLILQSIVWPFIIAGVLTNIISAIFHAIFIFGADMGVKYVLMKL